MTSPRLLIQPDGSAAGRAGRADAAQRGARRRFYLLLLPTLLKVLWVHWTSSQEGQYARLGRRQAHPAGPLPLAWARWAAYRAGRVLGAIPWLRRRPCYWRSQVLYELLPRFGFAMELHLGASFQGDQTTPHLWVSSRGVVLVDDAESATRYAELTSYATENGRD